MYDGSKNGEAMLESSAETTRIIQNLKFVHLDDNIMWHQASEKRCILFVLQYLDAGRKILDIVLLDLKYTWSHDTVCDTAILNGGSGGLKLCYGFQQWRSLHFKVRDPTSICVPKCKVYNAKKHVLFAHNYNQVDQCQIG